MVSRALMSMLKVRSKGGQKGARTDQEGTNKPSGCPACIEASDASRLGWAHQEGGRPGPACGAHHWREQYRLRMLRGHGNLFCIGAPERRMHSPCAGGRNDERDEAARHIPREMALGRARNAMPLTSTGTPPWQLRSLKCLDRNALPIMPAAAGANTAVESSAIFAFASAWGRPAGASVYPNARQPAPDCTGRGPGSPGPCCRLRVWWGGCH